MLFCAIYAIQLFAGRQSRSLLIFRVVSPPQEEDEGRILAITIGHRRICTSGL